MREAKEGERLERGTALLAPGDRHLSVVADGSGYRTRLIDGPLVSRHRPSVDVLFRSVAQAAGEHGVGVIMTGMGDDGVDGLMEMKKEGAATIAQDEPSCVVFGMPKEAVETGAADFTMPLWRIANGVLERVAGRYAPRRRLG